MRAKTSGVTVRRATGPGRDRLYVRAATGRMLGWLDLVTGEAVLEVPSESEAFEAALAPYRQTSGV